VPAHVQLPSDYSYTDTPDLMSLWGSGTPRYVKSLVADSNPGNNAAVVAPGCTAGPDRPPRVDGPLRLPPSALRPEENERPYTSSEALSATGYAHSHVFVRNTFIEVEDLNETVNFRKISRHLRCASEPMGHIPLACAPEPMVPMSLRCGPDPVTPMKLDCADSTSASGDTNSTHSRSDMVNPWMQSALTGDTSTEGTALSGSPVFAAHASPGHLSGLHGSLPDELPEVQPRPFRHTHKRHPSQITIKEDDIECFSALDERNAGSDVEPGSLLAGQDELPSPRVPTLSLSQVALSTSVNSATLNETPRSTGSAPPGHSKVFPQACCSTTFSASGTGPATDDCAGSAHFNSRSNFLIDSSRANLGVDGSRGSLAGEAPKTSLGFEGQASPGTHPWISLAEMSSAKGLEDVTTDTNEFGKMSFPLTSLGDAGTNVAGVPCDAASFAGCMPSIGAIGSGLHTAGVVPPFSSALYSSYPIQMPYADGGVHQSLAGHHQGQADGAHASQPEWWAQWRSRVFCRNLDAGAGAVAGLPWASGGAAQQSMASGIPFSANSAGAPAYASAMGPFGSAILGPSAHPSETALPAQVGSRGPASDLNSTRGPARRARTPPPKSSAKLSGKEPPTCKWFLRGTCKFGAECRFGHQLPQQQQPQTQQQPPQQKIANANTNALPAPTLAEVRRARAETFRLQAESFRARESSRRAKAAEQRARAESQRARALSSRARAEYHRARAEADRARAASLRARELSVRAREESERARRIGAENAERAAQRRHSPSRRGRRGSKTLRSPERVQGHVLAVSQLPESLSRCNSGQEPGSGVLVATSASASQAQSCAESTLMVAGAFQRSAPQRTIRNLPPPGGLTGYVDVACHGAGPQVATMAPAPGRQTPSVPRVGCQVVWCDHRAFKDNSGVLRAQLETEARVPVKAHKSAEMCMRTLRKKRGSQERAATRPASVFLVSWANAPALVLSLSGASYGIGKVVVLCDLCGGRGRDSAERWARQYPMVETVAPSWEEALRAVATCVESLLSSSTTHQAYASGCQSGGCDSTDSSAAAECHG